MNYLTFYQIRDKKKKLVFENANKSCFAEIFNDNFSKRFKDDVLTFCVDPVLEKEELESFVKKVKEFGVLGKVVPAFQREDNFNLGTFYNCNFKHAIQIDISKYDSHFFFLAVIVLRTALEDPKVVKAFIQTNESGLDNWLWFCYCYGDIGATVHSYFPTIYISEGKWVWKVPKDIEFVKREFRQSKTCNFFYNDGMKKIIKTKNKEDIINACANDL